MLSSSKSDVGRRELSSRQVEMKTGEIIAVFVVATVIATVGYTLLRKRETFLVYDEQGNLVESQQA